VNIAVRWSKGGVGKLPGSPIAGFRNYLKDGFKDCEV
jgi:hypothetical protein